MKKKTADKLVDLWFGEFEKSIKILDERQNAAFIIYTKVVQALANKYRVHLATGHLSSRWQVRKLRGRYWRDDMDEPVHPVFADLAKLETMGEVFKIGPSNMELYSPEKGSHLAADKTRNSA